MARENDLARDLQANELLWRMLDAMEAEAFNAAINHMTVDPTENVWLLRAKVIRQLRKDLQELAKADLPKEDNPKKKFVPV